MTGIRDDGFEGLAMTALLFSLLLAASIPNADPNKICQSAKTTVLPEDQSSAFQSCVTDEQAARDELRQKWSQFPAAARATCAEPESVPVSYVEMLTCLEMQSGSNFGTGKLIPPPDISAPTPPAKPDANGAGAKQP
jgi:hypothetical protein